jgi:hypothetical protein
MYANGGYGNNNMNQIPVTQFGNGGSHEDNPLGGIPQGMGANGKMNLVEEGELKIPDPRPQSEGGFFIVSADPSMKITKTIAEDYNLPKKLVGKSVLKAAESILRKGTGREGDTIEENSINIDLSNFLDAHEELTAMAEAKEEGKFMEELAKLEEKYPEYMQALMGAPEPSMGEMPMDPSMQGQQGPSPEEQAMMEQEMMAQQGGMPPGAMPMGAPGMDPAMMGGMPPEAMGMPMMYGGPMEYKKGGNMIKRADGSYSQRGLWDNIRANKGSGKKPTKEMLEQEKKIKGNSMGYGGDMYEYGSTMGNMYFPGGVMDLPNTFISNSPLSTENLINQAKTLNDIGLSEEEKQFDPANQFSYQKSLGTAVGQALPAAANLAMGLFAPPKDYSGIMGRLDPVELERQQLGQRGVQLDQSFAQAQAAMEAAGGPGYMSNIGRLQQNRDQATQQALTDIENTNTQIANLEEKLNLEVQKGNLTAAQAELQLNEAAETAKAAMVGEGIQQIEDIATAGEQNKLAMMYNQMYAPNYKFDYQGNPFAGMFKKDQQTS